MKQGRKRLSILSAILLLALASCGEGDGGGTTSSSAAESSDTSMQSSDKSGGQSSDKSGGQTSSQSSGDKSEPKTRLTLRLADDFFVYDGQPHSLEVTSPDHIPEALQITYTNNGKIDAGVYEVTATITDPTDKYEFESPLKATMTIDKANLDFSNLVFEDDTVQYDGKPHTIVAIGNPASLEPTYFIYDYSHENYVQQAVDVGTYRIDAVWDYANYNKATRSAYLTIEQGVIDTSKIVFQDKIVTYDGEYHTIEASGEIPADANISYEYNAPWGYYGTQGVYEVGEYRVTARFVSERGNWESFTLEAKLTINPIEVQVETTFEDAEVDFDFNAHSLQLTQAETEYTVVYHLLDEEGNPMTNEQTRSIAWNANAYGSDGTYAGFTYIAFLHAGVYKLRATLIIDGNHAAPASYATLTIKPMVIADVTNEEIGFLDTEIEYDGESHSITCTKRYFTRNYYDFYFTAVYEGNEVTELGEHVVKAIITSDSSDIVFGNPELTATLTIGAPQPRTEGLIFTEHTDEMALIGYEGNDTVLEIPGRYKNKKVAISEAFFNSVSKFSVQFEKIIIGEGAYYMYGNMGNFHNLKEFHLPSTLLQGYVTLPQISSDYGGNGSRLCTIYTPLAKEDFDLTIRNIENYNGSIVYGYTGTKGVTGDNDAFEWADTLEGRVISKIGDIKGDLVLPSKIEEVPVVGLAAGAGRMLTKVTSITLPETLQFIGDHCFRNNVTLFHMVIPASVTKIGEYAFAGCINLVLYVEADEKPEGYNDTCFNTLDSAVHYGYKAGITVSDDGFDYRLNDEGQAIIVRAKSGADHLELPTQIDGHDVVGLDNHSLTYRQSHYVTLHDGLDSTHVTNNAFYGSTISFIIRNGYTSYFTKHSNTLIVESNDVVLAQGDTTYLYQRERSYDSSVGQYVYSKEIKKIVTNKADVTMPSMLEDEAVSLDDYNYYLRGNLMIESFTLGANAAQMASLEGCLSLKKIDISASKITSLSVYYTMGLVNLEQYILPEGLTSIGNGIYYGLFSLKTNVDDYGNHYLACPGNNYFALVVSYAHGIDYIAIQKGCVVVDFYQFLSYEGILVIPETVSYGYGSPSGNCEIFFVGEKIFSWNCRGVTHYTGEYGRSDDGFKYASTKEGYVIYGYVEPEEGAPETFIVPNAIDGHDIVRVNREAISYMNRVEKLVISEGIKVLEANFVFGCWSLKEVVLPSSAISVGSFGFSETPEGTYQDEQGNVYIGNETDHYIYLYALAEGAESLEIVVPSTVVGFKDDIFRSGVAKVDLSAAKAIPNTFRYSAVVEVILPEGITEIPASYFQQCTNLTKVTIPSTVTVIREFAFNGCSKLSVRLPVGMTTLENSALRGVAEAFVYEKVVNLESYALYSDSYKSVFYIAFAEKPESWEGVGFGSAKVVWGWQGDGVEGSFLYHLVSGVAYVYAYTGEAADFALPATVHGKGYLLMSSALEGVELTSLTLGGDDIQVIALAGTFKFDSLTIAGNIEYQASVPLSKDVSATSITIGKNCLCNISGLNITSCKVATIESQDFLDGGYSGFSCEKLVLAEGITSVPRNSIYRKWDADHIDLPSTLKSLGDYAFSGTDLREIILPEGVETIGYGAFSSMDYVSLIYIPESVETIARESFDYMNDYTDPCVVAFGAPSAKPGYKLDVNANSRKKPIFVFDADGTLEADDVYSYYHMKSVDAYGIYRFTAPVDESGASVYPSELVLPDTFKGAPILILADKLFSSSAFSTVESVTLPANLIRIGASTFTGCTSSSLTTIEMPASLKEIGDYAFQRVALTELNLISVEKIGREAFEYCTSLKTAVLGEGLQRLEYQAFYGCTALESVTLPSTLEYIGGGVFYNDSALTTLVMPGDKIDGFVVFDFAGLTSLGTYAFYNTALPDKALITARTVEALANAKLEQGAFSGFKVFLEAEARPSGWSYYFTTTYYSYREAEPSDYKYTYWRYVNGVPTPWNK